MLPSAEAKRRARALERELIAQTGDKTLAERVFSAFALGLGALTELAGRAGLLQQPGLLRVAHRMGALEGGVAEPRPFALHGGERSLSRRLSEDLADLARARLGLNEGPPPIGAWSAIAEGRGSVSRARPIACAAE
ncbi:MAG: hypothetical protein HYV09_01905 [Deltaproteobacteria bacterium]|nr:hypothetical protein [Deltaproteobacteria bacterium]